MKPNLRRAGFIRTAGADQAGRDNLQSQGVASISVRPTATFIASIQDDGSLIWSFKTETVLKQRQRSPGDRVIASGLDHYVYCLNAKDGSLIWKYKTGFEVDCSAAVIDGRVYFGGEDGFFYCLNLEDGSLIYKTERLGSMEGSFSAVAGRIYIGTEQGDLYCLQHELMARLFGKPTSAPIPIRRRQLPNGLVYTAAEDGFVYCFQPGRWRTGLEV